MRSRQPAVRYGRVHGIGNFVEVIMGPRNWQIETERAMNGKLEESDLMIAVSSDNHGNVRMSFGKPVAWVGFTKKQAIDIAKIILNHAKQKQMEAPLDSASPVEEE
jgi:hypothetical protein